VSAQCEPVHKNNNWQVWLRLLSKANIAGAPRLSCVQKKDFVNTGLEKIYRIYLIIVVYSKIQPNSKIQT